MGRSARRTRRHLQPVRGGLPFDESELGELGDRHLRRMRSRYGRRRQALVDALGAHTPQIQLTGLAGGFHAVAHLPAHLDGDTVIAAARDRSVGLYGMSTYRASRSATPPQLVMGFGNLTERAITRGIATVADVLTGRRHDSD